MGFSVALSNVILTLIYIIPGYLLCKSKKASAEHLSTMSAVLIYIGSPCIITSSFLNLDFNIKQFYLMGLFFVITLILQAAFILILYMLFRKKYNDAKYRIFTIASVMGNVGFFGLPIIKILLPDNPEVMCYSSVYVISMNIIVFTVGVFCLTQKRKFISLKSAIINPAVLSLPVALPLWILGANQFLPEMIIDSVNLISRMTAPLCMVILGIRLATVSFKKLFSRPIIYLICLTKLIIFPLFCYLAVFFLPLPYSFKASILILSGVPCASIVFNLAEMHKSETELSANCVLLSTLLCFITIPILTLLA